jgi:transcriptional regulator with XRE-family HTH domain
MRHDTGAAGLSLQRAGLPVPTNPLTQNNLRSGDCDDWIAYEFGRMRADLRLTVPALARRIGTDVSVINNFESGAVGLLPPWQETVRIVEGYAMMLGTDPSRILSRLLVHQTVVAPARVDPTHRTGALPIPLAPDAIAYHGPYPSAQSALATRNGTTARSVRAHSSDVSDDDDHRTVRRRRRARRVLAVVLLPALVAGAGFWIQSSPRLVYKVVQAMPSAVRPPMLASADFFILSAAPVRDGLKWIEVDNPRLRKGDKLRTTHR